MQVLDEQIQDYHSIFAFPSHEECQDLPISWPSQGQCSKPALRNFFAVLNLMIHSDYVADFWSPQTVLILDPCSVLVCKFLLVPPPPPSSPSPPGLFFACFCKKKKNHLGICFAFSNMWSLPTLAHLSSPILVHTALLESECNAGLLFGLCWDFCILRLVILNRLQRAFCLPFLFNEVNSRHVPGRYLSNILLEKNVEER